MTKRKVRRKPTVHTVPAPGGWANKLSGGDKVLSKHRKKAPAAKRGRREAIKRKTEHLIQKRDGTIGERNSYGGDPFPPRG